MAATLLIWRPIACRPKLALSTFSIAARLTRRTAVASHFHLIRPYSSHSPGSPNSHEPLRILFCGSDAFSCASLQALHSVMDQQRTDGVDVTSIDGAPGRIASLDVVVRPAKRTGRGLKNLIESPVKVLATDLGLPVHERDTFTGWTPPASASGSPPNMIVAVSFGLFVPPRLLKAAQFGGLNVHPSLLPDLHGAAPIEHAVLWGRQRTGVTIQTLHETTFDGGRRLLQGPTTTVLDTRDTNGQLGLPLDDSITSAALHQLLAPIGAHLLAEVLKRGLYLPERAAETEEAATYTPPFPPAAAPKFKKGDLQIVWRKGKADDDSALTTQTTAADIDRQYRALGALWTTLEPLESSKLAGQPKRAILDDISLTACPEASRDALQAALGAPEGSEWPAKVQTLTAVQDQGGPQEERITLPFVVDGESIVLPVGVGKDASNLDDPKSCLRIGSIKIEGNPNRPATRSLFHFALVERCKT